MRKLGTWGGSALAALLLLVGLSGLTQAQERDVAWLGVLTQSLNEGLRDGMDYRGEGVLVSRVVDESPADRAGIERGDVIVSLDGRAATSPQRLTHLVQGARVGETVDVVVSRDGRRRTLHVRLGSRPNDVERGRGTADRLERFRRDSDSDSDFDFETPPGRSHDGDRLLMRMGRGRLGVRVESADEGDDDDRASGARIIEVLDGTPADRAGLRTGDVITRVGDRRIESSDDLVEALRGSPEGRVTLTVDRRGQERRVEAELERAPQMFRMGPGREGMTMIRPRARATPRVEVRRDSRNDDEMEAELQRLREEVRELRQKLHDQEDEDDGDDDGDDDGR